MNIYNPLQYTGKSFTSSVKETFQQQEAKKQASIERMNETLRTQAAQGRLGSLANSILNDALTQASEQGLIGVNQYEIMNQAMPKFYAAKSAVTELNNAYEAELKAAQADESINVDANFLAYLNEKYYSDDVTLENIDAYAANAVNKGFNIAEHTEFLNDEHVLNNVIPTMVTQFSETDYGVIGEQNGMDVFGTTTTTGVVRANTDNIANFTANPQVEALLIKKARQANPDVDITNLDLQVSKEEQARLLNEVLDAKYPPSSSLSNVGVSQKDIINLQARAQRGNIKYQKDLEREEAKKLSKATYLIRYKMEQNPNISMAEAVAQLKAEKIGDKPRYNSEYLDRAFSDLSGAKTPVGQQEYQRNLEGAKALYSDPVFNSVEGIKSLNGRKFGQSMISVETIPATNDTPEYIEVSLTRGGEDQFAEPLKMTEYNAAEAKALIDALVSHEYGDRFVQRGSMAYGWDADQ